jgi:hypothetical protein
MTFVQRLHFRTLTGTHIGCVEATSRNCLRFSALLVRLTGISKAPASRGSNSAILRQSEPSRSSSALGHRLPRSNRGGLSAHNRSDLHRASHPSFAAIRVLSGPEAGRTAIARHPHACECRVRSIPVMLPLGKTRLDLWIFRIDGRWSDQVQLPQPRFATRSFSSIVSGPPHPPAAHMRLSLLVVSHGADGEEESGSVKDSR